MLLGTWQELGNSLLDPHPIFLNFLIEKKLA
jgi:hypothetical protein